MNLHEANGKSAKGTTKDNPTTAAGKKEGVCYD